MFLKQRLFPDSSLLACHDRACYQHSHGEHEGLSDHELVSLYNATAALFILPSVASGIIAPDSVKAAIRALGNFC